MTNPLPSDQPFRFMDLPKELRLTVYEHIPHEIKYNHICLGDDAKLILVTPHVPTSILATCKQVHAEAIDIVDKIVSTFILSRTPQLVSSNDDSAYTFMETVMNVAAEIHKELQSQKFARKLGKEAVSNLCGKQQRWPFAVIDLEIIQASLRITVLSEYSGFEDIPKAASWIRKAARQLLSEQFDTGADVGEMRLRKRFLHLSLTNDNNVFTVRNKVCKHVHNNLLRRAEVGVALTGFVLGEKEAFQDVIPFRFGGRGPGRYMWNFRSMSKENWENDWLENGSTYVGQTENSS